MSAPISLSEWRNLITQYAEVSSHPGVYVLGCFARHVTLYSQQVRGFNLVYGLHVLGKIKKGTRVAVVGAGAAGLAAAGALAHLECDVFLLEETEGPLTLQANSVHRWLHPRIYDWPVLGFFDTRARLPIFDWKADKADEVVSQIRQSWKTVENAGQVTALFSVSNLDVSRSRSAGYQMKWEQDDSKRSANFDQIILAIGFGLESERKPSISYWSPENIDDGNHPKWKNQRWLISGFGDGALTDLMRVCIKDFRYVNIVRELESTIGLTGVKADLELLHSKRNFSNEELSNSFYMLSTDLPSLGKLEHKLRPFLRQQGPQVFITGTSPHLYGRGSSVLNRLIVLLLSRLGAFTYLPGPSGAITSISPHLAGGDERYQVSFGYPSAMQIFDRVIVRHGTEPLIKTFAKRNMGENSCDELELAWSRVSPEKDFSRKPQWPTGYFGTQDVSDATSEGTDVEDPKLLASLRLNEQTFEEATRHFGFKISQLSFYKELRDDGSSIVTYAIDGLTSLNEPITGLHFSFESYAGKIGPPVLDPEAKRLGIFWRADAMPPDSTQSMEELSKTVRRTSGTVLFKKPLKLDDPPLTFNLQITVLNGDALTAWEFDQLYSKEDQRHVDLKPLKSPIEYFSRFVWCPVETLKVQLTLPNPTLGPVTSSMFALPLDTQIDVSEVLQNSIVQLYPGLHSQWNPDSGDWERRKDRAATDAMTLAHPSPQTWTLTLRRPSVGSCYSVDWKLPSANTLPESSETIAETETFRSSLLSYGRSRGQKEGFPQPQKKAIRRLLLHLHREVDNLQNEMSYSDLFDIELMTYDDKGRRLQMVDEIRHGKPVSKPSTLWFPFGLGLGGACFKQGDAPYIYYRKLVDENRLGPEYYLDTGRTKPHQGMVSIPLMHPGWLGPTSGESVEASRLCIGVVNISFEDEPRWLNALRRADDLEVVKLRAVCQNFGDQLSLQLLATGGV